jgi:hypothetical protein
MYAHCVCGTDTVYCSAQKNIEIHSFPARLIATLWSSGQAVDSISIQTGLSVGRLRQCQQHYASDGLYRKREARRERRDTANRWTETERQWYGCHVPEIAQQLRILRTLVATAALPLQEHLALVLLRLLAANYFS